MVGIVIVSHSYNLAQGLIEFLENFKTVDFPLLNGSDSNLKFGSTVENIKNTIKKADNGNGVLVIVDLGSSINNSIKAKMELEGQVDVMIADCPIVEGAISAVAANDYDIDLFQLEQISRQGKDFRKVK